MGSHEHTDDKQYTKPKGLRDHGRHLENASTHDVRLLLDQYKPVTVLRIRLGFVRPPLSGI